MFHLSVVVIHNLGHWHRERQGRRGLGGHHVLGEKVSSGKLRGGPVLGGHKVLRVVCHGAVYRLLARHGSEHGVMSCIRVGSILVELNLLGGHWVRGLHCNGLERLKEVQALCSGGLKCWVCGTNRIDTRKGRVHGDASASPGYELDMCICKCAAGNRERESGFRGRRMLSDWRCYTMLAQAWEGRTGCLFSRTGTRGGTRGVNKIRDWPGRTRDITEKKV